MSSSPSNAADPPDLSEGEILMNLGFELRDGLDRVHHLLERFAAGGLDEGGRAQAREGARRLAVEGRICFISLEELHSRLPEVLHPWAAMRVAARLTYCLLALSGEQPEPFALFSREELDTLLHDEGAEGWLSAILSKLPEGRGR